MVVIWMKSLVKYAHVDLLQIISAACEPSLAEDVQFAFITTERILKWFDQGRRFLSLSCHGGEIEKNFHQFVSNVELPV